MIPSRFLILALFVLPLHYFSFSQSVTISGKITEGENHEPIAYATIQLRTLPDSIFCCGTVSDETGAFSIENVKPGNYSIQYRAYGMQTATDALFVGSVSSFLQLPEKFLSPESGEIEEVVVTATQATVSSQMEKQTFKVEDNISQLGGSVLTAMQNLPGVTVSDGKVQLRGNDKVVVLIDGKQTAMTGFNSQSGLDNIPASAIERIEIINNPSAKFDANGNGGIINIILKKEKSDGFSGKAGMAGGLGALWIKKANLPGIRPQYQFTPKINPSISLSYRVKKVNLFFQADDLYTQTLNKNEFTTRIYDDGTVIQQQLKRNRNTNFLNSRIGLDWHMNDKNSITISGMFGSEKILDHGDEPFYNADLSQQTRLWQFLEDELKTTAMGTATWLHKFNQPGHQFSTNLNYTFHRENEKYYFDNRTSTTSGTDAFKLLSDENVLDFSADYSKPLKYGRFETGTKFRYRYIPTNMQFKPGANSVIDSAAGGWANYKEVIPAVYANYVIETPKYEAEIGVRGEYVRVNYDVNPNHPTYKSSGYDYFQPFPNVRLGYKFNANNRISAFFNRRVDRPNEVDIRIFPKYDDAEIIKVGNPSLRPQFTNSYELGYRSTWKNGFFYIAAYRKDAHGTITRISSIVPGSTWIYAIFQNAGRSSNTGIDMSTSHKITSWFTVNLSANVYYNRIEAFTVQNLYPSPNTYTSSAQDIYSGNAKLNMKFQLKKNAELQLTAIYLAPDIIPQGKTNQRFSLNLGAKKSIQKGKGEVFINASDLFNTLVIRKTVYGDGFHYTSTDYYETQVINVGYVYKF